MSTEDMMGEEEWLLVAQLDFDYWVIYHRTLRKMTAVYYLVLEKKLMMQSFSERFHVWIIWTFPLLSNNPGWGNGGAVSCHL